MVEWHKVIRFLVVWKYISIDIPSRLLIDATSKWIPADQICCALWQKRQTISPYNKQTIANKIKGKYQNNQNHACKSHAICQQKPTMIITLYPICSNEFKTLNVGTVNSTFLFFSSLYSGLVEAFSARTRNSFNGSPSTVVLKKVKKAHK